MRLFWAWGLVGIGLMGFSYNLLDTSSTLGTFIGMTGMAFFLLPFFVKYKLNQFALQDGGEKNGK